MFFFTLQTHRPSTAPHAVGTKRKSNTTKTYGKVSKFKSCNLSAKSSGYTSESSSSQNPSLLSLSSLLIRVFTRSIPLLSRPIPLLSRRTPALSPARSPAPSPAPSPLPSRLRVRVRIRVRVRLRVRLRLICLRRHTSRWPSLSVRRSRTAADSAISGVDHLVLILVARQRSGVDGDERAAPVVQEHHLTPLSSHIRRAPGRLRHLSHITKKRSTPSL